MATLGNTAEPTASAEAYEGGTNNYHAIPLTFPAGGPWRVERIGFYAAGYNGSVAAQGVVWSSTGGTIYGATAGISLTHRAFSPSGSDLYDRAIATPFNVAGGVQVMAGFARSTAGGAFFGKLSTGFHREKAQAYPGGLMSGYTTDSSGAMVVYLSYLAASSGPNAPTSLTPTGGVLITGSDLTPALAFLYSHPDLDDMSAYEIELDNNSDFSSPVWDSGKVALVKDSGDTVTVSVGTSLSRGVLYYWRARVWDASDNVSGWSA